jgi:hypothetical protein
MREMEGTMRILEINYERNGRNYENFGKKREKWKKL